MRATQRVTMFRPLIAASLLVSASTAAMAQETPAIQQTLSLSATADIQIEPEFATVRSGVVVTAPTAQAAVRENAQMMNAVFAALRWEGVDRRDMQTASLTLQPHYEWDERRTERRLTGYTAQNIVSARVRDLEDVGDVVDAMVSAGANNIQSVSFGAEDTADELDQARRMAVQRLMEKAELYASAAGLELCGIVRMSENQALPRPLYANDMMRMEAGAMADTPVAAGELTLSASVHADFCISNG